MAIRGPYNQTGLCKFNNYVWCESRESCETCGWNPEVIATRKAENEERFRPEAKKSWTYSP